jgi:hypothetical protein
VRDDEGRPATPSPLDRLVEHDESGALPTSVRFLYYELEQAEIVPKAYRHRTKRARQPSQDGV